MTFLFIEMATNRQGIAGNGHASHSWKGKPIQGGM
jgi:hypothetical protein